MLLRGILYDFHLRLWIFVSVFLRGVLLRGECVQAVRGGPGQLTRLRARQVLRRLRVQ